MDSTKGQATTLLLTMLGAARSTMLALDARGRIVAMLPGDRPFAGRAPGELLGRPFASSLKADFVRVFDGIDGWDELGYIVDASGDRSPHLIRRLKAGEEPFAGLYPDAAELIFASPLPAYASLEDAHQRSATEHARELEALNAKLRRRSRRLKRALDVLEARNRQITADLNLAVELQKSLLPKRYPAEDLFSFTHRYIPMAMVGGDFFDIVALSDHEVGVMMSDVSGHGVAPAFITAMIKSSFDHLAVRGSGPAEVMGRINQEFSKIIETDHYVTACYAVFDFLSMSCRYCNAGHPPQLIARADGGFAELEATSPIIGLSDDCEYDEAEVPFSGGDVICFYTDGIIEARDASDRLFDVAGVKASLRASMDGGLEAMADGMVTDLIQFMKEPYFEDDITVLLGQAIESL